LALFINSCASASGCVYDVITCNDNNACTADTCPVAGGGCVFSAPFAGCCNSNADCSDGDACTADVCSGPGGSCQNITINGCCNTDMDCTKGNLCSSAKCPMPGGFCVGGSIPGCCNVDSDCADNDACTTDKECGSAAVCFCRDPNAATANVCAHGNCVTDSDCNGDYCSPSGLLVDVSCRSGLSAGQLGYFCHTASDECRDDLDCAGKPGLLTPICAFSTSTLHWACVSAPCAD
jgi:hypothetical protein